MKNRPSQKERRKNINVLRADMSACACQTVTRIAVPSGWERAELSPLMTRPADCEHYRERAASRLRQAPVPRALRVQSLPKAPHRFKLGKKRPVSSTWAPDVQDNIFTPYPTTVPARETELLARLASIREIPSTELPMGRKEIRKRVGDIPTL